MYKYCYSYRKNWAKYHENSGKKYECELYEKPSPHVLHLNKSDVRMKHRTYHKKNIWWQVTKNSWNFKCDFCDNIWSFTNLLSAKTYKLIHTFDSQMSQILWLPILRLQMCPKKEHVCSYQKYSQRRKSVMNADSAITFVIIQHN